MSDTRSVYLVGPPGPIRDRVAERFPGARLEDGAADFLADADASPGIVLIDADDLAADDVLAVVEALGRGEGEWTCCLVREQGSELVVRTMSLGWKQTPDDVEAFLEGDDSRLLEIRRAVKRISRARHDVNNPLTSALAETQLLLMDVEDPEITEALWVIQNQLRRIRDLVAATGVLRKGKD